MALENFTTYTTVDTFSQLTVTANNITQNNGDCQNPAYVYKDEGGVYFGDFTHKFTIVLSRGSGSPFLAHWAIANNVASLYQLTQYIYMDAFYYAVGHWELGYYDSGAHHAGTGFAVPDGTYYVTVIRTGLTTILFNIYSDSARTILVYTFGGTCINTTFRYVYGFNNYGNNTFIGLNSNQTQDLNLTGAYTDWTKSLSDSQGSSDALTKKVGKSLSDSQGSSDALTKKVAKPLSDSVSESDGIILNIGKGITLSDSISESDSIMKDSIKDLNDGVSESDAITKENAKSLSDSVTVIDTEVSNLELTLTENVSVNEALVKGVKKLFSDSIHPTDASPAPYPDDHYNQAQIGLFGCRFTGDGSTYPNPIVRFNYIHVRRLRDITVNCNMLIDVTNIIVVNCDMEIDVRNYLPVTEFEVRQHIFEPIISLYWENPVDANFISTIIIRKMGSYPVNVNDGTVVVETTAESFDDTFPTKGKIYYGAFAKYVA